MTALERVTAILEQARIAGGWIDEDVARAVMSELGLADDGYPIQPATAGDTAATEPEPPAAA